MIFTVLLYGLICAGCLFFFLDNVFLSMGVPVMPVIQLSFKMIGVVVIFLGAVLYHSRMLKTGAEQIGDMPDPGKVKCFHMGKSGFKIYTGVKCEPNRIRVKIRSKGRVQYMNIKDTGDTVPLAGHTTVFSSQDNGHTIPLWLVDAVEKWKRHYGIRNEEEFLRLYEQIKNIRSHQDLEAISLLRPIVNDKEKWEMIQQVDLDVLREMKELLFDGRTINVKEYLDWADGATPYDNEAIIDSTVSQMRAQDAHLLNRGTVDMLKWILPISVLFICGALAYQIIGGG